VRSHADDPPAQTLALVAAIALFDTAARFVEAARLAIKWPNDLLLDGRKLAGILLERIDEVVVLGFGVNLASHPEDVERPAVSLAAAGLAPPSPDAFAAGLATAFAAALARWREEGLDATRDDWLARAHPAGTPLVARIGEREALTGTFDGLADDGALKLRLADGSLRVIHAGDVFAL
jgi:BirA family biotin operon repressor/biotin-[acetyl-CoA-carboxylase] ligase